MNSDDWKNGVNEATKFLSDPAAMEAMQRQVRRPAQAADGEAEVCVQLGGKMGCRPVV